MRICFWNFRCSLGINTSMQYVLSISDKRIWIYQGDKVLICRKKLKMAAMTRIFYRIFYKNWCSLWINNCIQYVNRTPSESKKRFCGYQGDKVLIWRKKLKDGLYDPNIFPNIVKKLMQPRNYYLHSVCWTPNESKNRLCRYQGDRVWMKRRPSAAAPPPETVQNQKAPPPRKGSLNEWGFGTPLCTNRLKWDRKTFLVWWHE